MLCAHLNSLIMEDLRALNNCEPFKQLRTGLTNYHTLVKPLNSFNYISGNDQPIKEIAEVVLNVLLEHNLVIENIFLVKAEEHLEVKVNPAADLDRLRGILMYLILNSAMGKKEKELELAKWNPQFVHLLKQLPEPLTQVLTVSIALLCGLHELLFEFFAYGPAWLTSQYFDRLSGVLGHFVENKVDTLTYIGGALNAVTNAICYRYSMPIIDNSMALLQRHLLSSEERLRSALPTSSGRNRYLAKSICMLLDVVVQILNCLQKPPRAPNYASIYALHSSPVHPDNVPLPSAQQQLQIFGCKLMDSVQLLLQLISVDTYMTWHEMKSDHVLFNMQAQVSNRCLKVTQLLASGQKEHESLFNHSLNSQLSNFVGGAQSFEQCLSDLTLGELLSFLDGESGEASDEELSKALDELLSRSICFGSAECVQSMVKHKHLMGAKHLLLMIEHLGQVVQLRKAEVEEMDGIKAETAAANPANGQEQARNYKGPQDVVHTEPPNAGNAANEQETQPELMDIELPSNAGRREQEEEDLHNMQLDVMNNSSTSSGDDDDSDHYDYEIADVNAPYTELINSLVLPLYQSITDTQVKMDLLHKRDQLDVLHQFVFYQPQYMSRRIFFYNQLGYWKDNFPINEFLDLCFEQPEETWLDFARLGMKHQRFCLLYLTTIKRLLPHSLILMESTVKSLLNDVQLATQSATTQYATASTEMLLCLYEQPILLQRIDTPVAALMLQQQKLPFRQSQERFLADLIEALSKFSLNKSFSAVEKTMLVLLQLDSVERQLMKTAKDKVKSKHSHLNRLLQSKARTNSNAKSYSSSIIAVAVRRARHQLQLAKAQMILHYSFHRYRSTNWDIIAQVVLSMDQLRAKPENFHRKRIAALDQTLKYYIKHANRLITSNEVLRGRLRLLIAEKVEHKHLWHNEELDLLRDAKRSISEYTKLLSVASTVESIQLLRCAIRLNFGLAVLQRFSDQVDAMNSDRAQNAYNFTFKCYMQVLYCEMIQHADPSKYPLLIEHILRAPKIANPENILSAMSNFKVLLRPTGVRSQALIQRFIAESLALANRI
ncbi:uncharacterized protein LOC6585725 isoform X1 [Drosophila mojavensis]|uniref:Uncharacterized protein, isoform C n=2 Tax=Drosophila mojavensis TaxID=7230 RepID=A0A0Q9XF08_DROMO|nr:uncharacterized protein LOC6585725 isoform X1 [Drosophila mojavensis]KRG07174.1 uncharacterized protein Dmoj_GI16483, isoform C [Drosophila mojavensis]